MGPHTLNFSEAAALAEAEGAALRVVGMAEAGRAGLGLVRDSAALAEARAAGLAFAARNRRRYGQDCGGVAGVFVIGLTSVLCALACQRQAWPH